MASACVENVPEGFDEQANGSSGISYPVKLERQASPWADGAAGSFADYGRGGLPVVAPAIGPAKQAGASATGVGGLPSFQWDRYTAEFQGLAAEAARREGAAKVAWGLSGEAARTDSRKRGRCDDEACGKLSRSKRFSDMGYVEEVTAVGASELLDSDMDGSRASDEDSDKTESDDSDNELSPDMKSHEPADAAPQPSKRSRTERRVTWGSDVKEHDGLCRENEITDLLVWGFFSTGKVHDVATVARIFGADTGLFSTVISLLDDLADRIACSMKDVPVLPRGGGSAAKLSPCHLSNLLQLRELVAVTSEEVGGIPATHIGGASASDEYVTGAVVAAAPCTFTADLGELDPVSRCDFAEAFSNTDALDVLASAAAESGDVVVDVLGMGPGDGVAYSS